MLDDHLILPLDVFWDFSSSLGMASSWLTSSQLLSLSIMSTSFRLSSSMYPSIASTHKCCVFENFPPSQEPSIISSLHLRCSRRYERDCTPRYYCHSLTYPDKPMWGTSAPGSKDHDVTTVNSFGYGWCLEHILYLYEIQARRIDM